MDSFVWANSSDTFVDVFPDPKNENNQVVHWMSESSSL
jgi:hypothetical protein